MAARDILLLGNDALYRTAREVTAEELEKAGQVMEDLRDTMLEFRRKYAFGRAIAAPQIGEGLRMIYMNVAGASTAIVNPRLELGPETFEVWDDCMSFPGLEVRLMRHRKCRLRFKDLAWQDRTMDLTDDLAELIQHEYDHLDGILAVQRAIDNKSFRINPAKAGCF
ncbi:MAG TPA: peptide deformylase [Selenomonadales bacterium]|nr:peptide deformylase [Selenomonadales bacterium]